ncbi:MAG: gamma-glutamyltransferase [Chitinophagaceae bacterium]|nr:gamma-glutamyltransferase [Chitinophagaceae bacterium]
MKKTTILAFFALAVTTVQAQLDPYHYKISKNIKASKGAVVSAHPLASEAGLWVMKQGGNAVDAVIATQLALAVVYPGAGNIGGGGFMVARLQNGKNIAIDYREKAPGKATRDMYLNDSGNVVKDLSVLGHKASGVPGTIAGLFSAHQFAKLPFAKLIEPAIQLAKGFAITEAEARSLNNMQTTFKKYNTHQPAFVKATPWKVGDTLLQPELEKTLIRIQKNGMKGFYEGETAQFIVEEMQRGNGIISLEDLKSYKAKVRKAVVFPYKSYSILTMPLPSSGGIILPQLLHVTEKYNLRQMKFQSPEAVQLMIEAERRAYADRAEFLGDTDFVKVPVKRLSSAAYMDERMKDFVPGKAGNSDLIGPGKIAVESEETTHISVVDAWGNAVSATTTLNGGYGSGTVVGGAGFLMNNEMDDFSVKPGQPNMFGALGKEANAIQPGKRMLSSMAPSIVLKNGKPYIVVGTPGGTTIPTSVFQSIVNMIDFGMSADSAVNQPKFHHQWKPDVVYIEKEFPKTTLDALTKMGYKFQLRGGIGRTEIILINGKQIEAVGDKRGDDSAAGF